ncbi:MAG: MFS transporter [Aerococcus sp.]|nr:MFS transporter [Aerococcus sp.]
MEEACVERPNALSKVVIGLLGSLTLMFYTTELAPSGLLTQISTAFSEPLSKVAWLVAVYTLPSALLAIPLTRFLARMNRRVLLLTLLFSLSVLNTSIALSPNFWVMLVARFLSGMCAAIFWPMIAPYTLAIAPPLHGGRAIALVLTGSSLGLSVGVPLTTALGRLTSWRFTFALIAGIYLLIFGLGLRYFPNVVGNRTGKVPHPKELLRLPGIRVGLSMVMAFVIGEYSTYVYIQMIAQYTHLNATVLQLLFGFGAISAILVVQRLVDEYLHQVLLTVAGFGIVAMLGLLFLSNWTMIVIVMGIIWGMSFGPLSTLFQTTFTRQVDTNKEVAVSLESSTFDISIMLTTVIAGHCFDQWGIHSNLIVALLAFTCAFMIIYRYRGYLK